MGYFPKKKKFPLLYRSRDAVKEILRKIGVEKESIWYKIFSVIFHNIVLSLFFLVKKLNPFSAIEDFFGVRLYGWERRNHSNKYYGSDYKAYDKLYSKNAEWWHGGDYIINRSIINLLSQGVVKELDMILDLGCGHARTLARLSHYLVNLERIKLIGLDFSSAGLQLASRHKFKKNSILHLICADMTRTPFKDKTFSIVISNGSHEHIENPDFKEVRRILKDDGFFLCLMPVVGDNDPEVLWEVCRVQRENKFRKQKWIDLLKRDGFDKIDYVDSVFICSAFY